MVASTEGGMDIEDVAHNTPEKITTITIDPAQGFMPHHGRAAAFALKLSGDLNKACQKLCKQLYTAFTELDCEMLEINPLVETKDGQLLVLDTKMSFDGNALYRHKDVEAMRDETEEDPAEVEASKHDLAYIKLDGNIGCMVNGAGLAMATMDIIKPERCIPRQLPRCGRRRDEGKGDGGVQADPVRRRGRGHSGQYLRRHHEMRHHPPTGSWPRRRM